MKSIIVYFLMVSMLYACSKPEEFKVPHTAAAAPTRPVTISPAHYSLCRNSIAEDGKSLVAFEWTKSLYAEDYELKVKLIFSGEESSFYTKNTFIEVPLYVNAVYSWKVIARNGSPGRSTETGTSMFYNSGLNSQFHSPFPAELMSPQLDQKINPTERVELFWQGFDVDDDLKGYSLYFGTEKEPPLMQENIIANQYVLPLLIPGKVYYWRIISIDEIGYESSSEIYRFRVMDSLY